MTPAGCIVLVGGQLVSREVIGALGFLVALASSEQKRVCAMNSISLPPMLQMH